MADIWASQSEIVSQVLQEQRMQKNAHEAVASALQKKAATVDDACWMLQQKLTDQAKQINELRAQLAARGKSKTLDSMNSNVQLQS